MGTFFLMFPQDCLAGAKPKRRGSSVSATYLESLQVYIKSLALKLVLDHRMIRDA